ncbi:MAG TPA: DUF1007 family protein, partial [Firmicutes bacterium]|nr:DUF1007 family protein [Bacillota bacterium]
AYMIKKAVFMISFLSFAGCVFSHPHVFIEPQVTLIVKKNFVEKAVITWIFDRMTSSAMIEHLGGGEGKSLDGKKVKKIKDEIFPGLSQYGYYTFISIDGGENMEIKPRDLDIRISEEGNLIYEFTVPVEREAGSKVSVYFEDDEIYTAFDFEQWNISVRESGGGEAEITVNTKERPYANILEVEF